MRGRSRLGSYSFVSGSNRSLTLIASERNGINYPRDLAFNPTNPQQLWVVNQTDDSAVIIENPGFESQKSMKVIDPAADHFMEEVSSISFASI